MKTKDEVEELLAKVRASSHLDTLDSMSYKEGIELALECVLGETEDAELLDDW